MFEHFVNYKPAKNNNKVNALVVLQYVTYFENVLNVKFISGCFNTKVGQDNSFAIFK